MLNEFAQVMAQVLAPIALMALIGFVLQNRLHLDIRAISRLVFYVLAPCLVYTTLVTLDVDRNSVWRSILFAALNMAVMLALALVLSRRWGYAGGLGSAFAVATILLNNGNYGLPLSLFAFGPEGFNFALVLFLFNSLVGTTISVYLLARARNAGAWQPLRHTLMAPVVWAMVLGLLSRGAGWQPPDAILEMLTLAGRSAIPVFIIVLGMTLADTRAIANVRAVSRLTVLRMVGGPTLGIVIGRLVGLSGVAYSTAVLQASMPTAVNSIVLGTEFDAAPDFAAGAVFATTLVSLVTVPGLLLWLR